MLNYITVNEGAKETIICLHGFGSSPENMSTIAQQLGDYRYILPAAPHSYLGGYGWYNVLKKDEAHRNKSIKMLLDFIASTKEKYGFEKCFLLGFSQGAELALKISIENPQLIKGAVSIVGWLMEPEKLAPCREAVPILAINGSRDYVLPPTFCKGKCIEENLTKMGIPCDLRVFKMGHEMNSEAVACIKEWLGSHTF